jgi:hypothetical protein
MLLFRTQVSGKPLHVRGARLYSSTTSVQLKIHNLSSGGRMHAKTAN